MSNNTSYTRDSITAISDALKIFTGKKSEIADLQKTNQIIPRKWYLAYDTGEFFVASSSGALIQYGGTNNNLSSDDIATLINNLTVSQLQSIREQITDLRSDYVKNRLDIEYNEKQIDKLEKILNETLDSTINVKIQKAIDATEISVTQTDLTTAVNNKFNELKTYSDNKFLTTNSITNYITKTEVSELLENVLRYVTGNKLSEMVAANKNGVYFVTALSTDTVYLPGHVYLLSNGVAKDLTAATTSTLPVIHTYIDGYPESTIKVGDSFTGKHYLSYIVDNPSFIVTNLKFYNRKDSALVLDDLSAQTPERKEFTANLTNLTYGMYNYSLVGQDNNGNVITGDYTLNVINPMYYGVSSSDEITVLTGLDEKISENINGTYNFNIEGEEKYLYFLIPTTVSKVIPIFYMNGFEASITKRTNVTIGGVTYYCYRSVDKLEENEYTIILLN